MLSIKLALSGGCLALLIVACGSSDPPPTTPATTPGVAPTADPYGAYYPACTYAGQTNCTPAAPGAVPAATVAPGAAGPMATPGPLALPCTADSACILARCNTQYGKCAYPCQTAADCSTGASCNAMSGLCLPGGS